MTFVPLVIALVSIVGGLLMFPKARRFDRRILAQRKEAGKSPSAVPPVVIFAVAIVAIMGGSLLASAH